MPSWWSLDEDVRALYAPGMRLLDCGMMALPLAEGFGEENIMAMFEALGALFWVVDDF